MKSLFESLYDSSYNKTIINEYAQLVAEEMINESFKSSIVQKLAKAIYDAEKDHNKREVDTAKRMDKEYPSNDGYKHKPRLINFASIFGPKESSDRYGNNKKKLQGLKWSEIKDEDFKEYAPDDKELIKLIKSSYGKKDGNADFIVMTKNGQILNFIKAYGESEKSDGMYYFKTDGEWGNGVKELKKHYYSYQLRSLKVNEVIDVLKELATIEGVKVYALEITSDMVKEYSDIISDRAKSQEGVINYDKDSLRNLLKKQQARYKALVAEMKAKKLMQDPESLFNDIKKVNDEVVELYKKIFDSPENLDKNFEIGCLMDYVSRAYDEYYRYLKESKSAERSVQRAKDKGYSDEEADKWGEWHRGSAKNSINDVKEYLNKIKKEIENIKSHL